MVSQSLSRRRHWNRNRLSLKVIRSQAQFVFSVDAITGTTFRILPAPCRITPVMRSPSAGTPNSRAKLNNHTPASPAGIPADRSNEHTAVIARTDVHSVKRYLRSVNDNGHGRFPDADLLSMDSPDRRLPDTGQII
jgi:hypothetical protein